MEPALQFKRFFAVITLGRFFAYRSNKCEKAVEHGGHCPAEQQTTGQHQRDQRGNVRLPDSLCLCEHAHHNDYA